MFAERVRESVAKHLFSDGKEEMRITLSLGVAVTDKEEIVDAKNLVRRADSALYEAKKSGKNRVCVYK